MKERLRAKLREFWQGIRQITGDDAYERYLQHWRATHATDETPLDRKEFFRREQQRRWSGVRRCC